MAAVYLGLGSNIDAERNLRLAVAELRRLFGTLKVSPVYRSTALGFEGSDFLNLVVALEAETDPLEIVEHIERRLGRVSRTLTWPWTSALRALRSPPSQRQAAAPRGRR